MTHTNLKNIANLEEEFNCNINLSPPLSMTHKLYTENQIIQGLKNQDQIILGWIYKQMAREVFDLFEEMKITDITVEKDYEEIFFDGLGKICKDNQLFKHPNGILKIIKKEFKIQTIEKFFLHKKIKDWLFKEYNNDILQLIKEIKISPIQPNATLEIFNAVYTYFYELIEAKKYKTGNFISNLYYTIKLKTAEYYIKDDKTWSWIDKETRAISINTLLYKVKGRQDINCDEVFTETLDTVWNNVKDGKYTIGNNIFYYLQKAYGNRLSNLLKKKRVEILSENDAPFKSDQKDFKAWETSTKNFDSEVANRLTKEILCESMIKTLDQMKDNARKLIYDTRIAGKSHREIAESQGIKELSIKVKNNRATTSLLDQYFKRLLTIVNGEMSDDCIEKLQKKSLYSKEEGVVLCRKKLKSIVQHKIKNMIDKVITMDPALPEEGIKSFVHFLLGRQILDKSVVSTKDLAKWKADTQ